MGESYIDKKYISYHQFLFIKSFGSERQLYQISTMGTQVEEAMDLMEILCNIFGVYTGKRGRKTFTQICFAVYCVFIGLVQIGNSLRVIIFYKEGETFGPIFIRKVILTIIEVSSPLTNFLLARGFKHMNNLKMALNDAIIDSTRGLGFILKCSIVTFSRIVLAIVLLPLFFSIAGSLYAYFSEMESNKSYKEFMYPVSPNSTYALPYLMFAIFAGHSRIALWNICHAYSANIHPLLHCGIVAMLTVLTFILYQQFYLQSLRLSHYKKQLQDENKTFSIEQERLQYEKLLDVLENVNSLLSTPMSLILHSIFVIICLTVYNVVYARHEIIGSTLDYGIGVLCTCIGAIILIDCALISWAVSI